MSTTVSDPVRRDGPLRNGNHRGDPSLAPRCAARTRAGKPCRSPAMKNGRCRMHGGASTGPTTAAGRERSRAANLVHGHFTAEVLEEKRWVRRIVWASTAMIGLLRKPRRRAARKKDQAAVASAGSAGSATITPAAEGGTNV